MKENWTCENVIHSKSKYILVKNMFYNNEIINFGVIDLKHFNINKYIGVWKIKTLKK